MGREHLTQHASASFCNDCGFVTASVTENGHRCTECGRFVDSDPDVCCVRHEITSSPYPSGICPQCEQEQSIRAQEREMHQRRADPSMHPSVDARRY